MTVASESSTRMPQIVEAARPARKRLLWPDVARGFAILLVVLGHAIGGLISSGQVAPGSALQKTFYFIYTFHMPLFFFLSGGFIEGRIRKNPRKVVSDSLLYLAYPYFLWGLLQLIVITQLGGAVNTPYKLTPHLLIGILWSPPSQFWFLYALFVYQFAALVLVPRLSAFAIVIAAAVLCGIANFYGTPGFSGQVLRYGLFYALGVWVGPTLVASLEQWPQRLLIAAGAAVLWFAFAAFSDWFDGDFLNYPIIPAAICGSFSVIVFASLVRGPLASHLAALGRNTMPIFLLHVLFVAGTRIALKHFCGVTAVGLVLPIAVAAGVLGPLAVLDVTQRLHVAGRLGLTKG